MRIDDYLSIRVAEKNGMKLLKQFRKNVIGTIVNEVLYCIHRRSITVA